jgi:hypothetical protein
MPTVTFILGLCGAGKTWLADRVIATVKFDEGFLGKQIQHDALIALLRSGHDAVVVEIAYCQATAREAILREIGTAAPNAHVVWLCIENDLFRANKNCRERRKQDPETHVQINERLSPVYEYPEGAVVLRMWTKEC